MINVQVVEGLSWSSVTLIQSGISVIIVMQAVSVQ